MNKITVIVSTILFLPTIYMSCQGSYSQAASSGEGASVDSTIVHYDELQITDGELYERIEILIDSIRNSEYLDKEFPPFIEVEVFSNVDQHMMSIRASHIYPYATEVYFDNLKGSPLGAALINGYVILVYNQLDEYLCSHESHESHEYSRKCFFTLSKTQLPVHEYREVNDAGAVELSINDYFGELYAITKEGFNLITSERPDVDE